MRHAPRQVGRPHYWLNLRRPDGRWCCLGHLGNNFRSAAEKLNCNSLCRLHDIWLGKRNRRSRCDSLHCQMVQRWSHCLRHGPAACNREARDSFRLNNLSSPGRNKGSRGDVFIGRDGPSCILGIDVDASRNDSLGYFRRHGRSFRQTGWVSRPRGRCAGGQILFQGRIEALEK